MCTAQHAAPPPPRARTACGRRTSHACHGTRPEVGQQQQLMGTTPGTTRPGLRVVRGARMHACSSKLLCTVRPVHSTGRFSTQYGSKWLAGSDFLTSNLNTTHDAVQLGGKFKSGAPKACDAKAGKAPTFMISIQYDTVTSFVCGIVGASALALQVQVQVQVASGLWPPGRRVVP